MKTVDPVCGMQVNIQKMTLKSEYQGQTYYFCTIACREAFDVHPEKYIIRGFSHSGDENYEYQEVSQKGGDNNGEMSSLQNDG